MLGNCLPASASSLSLIVPFTYHNVSVILPPVVVAWGVPQLITPRRSTQNKRTPGRLLPGLRRLMLSRERVCFMVCPLFSRGSRETDNFPHGLSVWLCWRARPPAQPHRQSI